MITTFNRNCRIFDDDTLEHLGVWPKGTVHIEKRERFSLGFCEIKLWHVLVLAFALVFPYVILVEECHKEEVLKEQILQYEEEIAGYEEVTSLNMEYLTVEMLAGRHATFKGKNCTDRDTLFKFICESGAWYPEITMAQLVIESGGFKSNVGVNANNGFGMKKCGEGPQSRPNLQIPGVNHNGYGKYMNWYHSVLDRHLWDLWVFRGKRPATRDEYLKRIGNVYAENPKYCSMVMQVARDWEKKAKEYADTSTQGSPGQ